MATRFELIRELCAERGSWGDGTEATEENMMDAAEHPTGYDIDPSDLDEACEGDASALLRLRNAWGLRPLV